MGGGQAFSASKRADISVVKVRTLLTHVGDDRQSHEYPFSSKNTNTEAEKDGMNHDHLFLLQDSLVVQLLGHAANPDHCCEEQNVWG